MHFLCTTLCFTQKHKRMSEKTTSFVEHRQCPAAQWYLFRLSDFDKLVSKLETTSHDLSLFSNFDLKIDTAEWSSVSPRYATISEAIDSIDEISTAADASKVNEAMISLRLYYRPSVITCNSSVLNRAKHSCKVCKHDFLENSQQPELCEPRCYCPQESNLDIKNNAKQTIQYFSELAMYSEGDGKAFAQHTIVKPADEPGKSLLKEAIASERDAYRDPAETRVPFQTFTVDRPALVPRAAAPTTRGRRFIVHGASVGQYGFAPRDCLEDAYDIEHRQQGGFYNRHYPTERLSRQDYFENISLQKGVEKQTIVANQQRFE